ncbi:MAG: DUF1674 domain-containing protein [Hyphomonadaceae bacterium]|nr:MAG: hypothetical protein FD160_708 [Caulobacteraceae bacterium]MBT9444760.1 DUF1674 domain-containing protein [Hyphomonadaceae bacterium]TPW05975.1 MAG: hypothetical protein FD124_1943 [Alphaproteobacteria bacterium]
MTDEKTNAGSRESDPAAPAAAKPLTPAAQRALAEAAERRKVAADAALAEEKGGPAGAEPTRFGDWERRGLAVDF